MGSRVQVLTWTILHCLLTRINGELDWTWSSWNLNWSSNMRCWRCKWQLNPLYHNKATSTFQQITITLTILLRQEYHSSFSFNWIILSGPFSSKIKEKEWIALKIEKETLLDFQKVNFFCNNYMYFYCKKISQNRIKILNGRKQLPEVGHLVTLALRQCTLKVLFLKWNECECPTLHKQICNFLPKRGRFWLKQINSNKDFAQSSNSEKVQ